MPPDRLIPAAHDASRASAERDTPGLEQDPVNGRTTSKPKLAPPASRAPADRRIEDPPGFRDRGGESQTPAPPVAPPKERAARGPAARGGLLGRPRPRPAILTAAALAILAAGAAVAWLTGLTSSGKPATRSGLISPLEETTTNGTTTNGGSASPVSPVINRQTNTPFVLAGARFVVSANATQPWTDFKRTVHPGPGRRWLLVGMQVRNISRAGFDPRVLHYRVTTRSGVTYFPNVRYGTGPDVNHPANPVRVGATVQVELAFQVPTSAAGLQLAFDPTGQHERLVVALGR
jgi:hypothetical protein